MASKPSGNSIVGSSPEYLSITGAFSCIKTCPESLLIYMMSWAVTDARVSSRVISFITVSEFSQETHIIPAKSSMIWVIDGMNRRSLFNFYLFRSSDNRFLFEPAIDGICFTFFKTIEKYSFK